MAPNPNKTYRVCDTCFGKLKNATEPDSSFHSSLSRRGSMNKGLNESFEKDEKLDSGFHVQVGRYSSIQEVETECKKKKLEFNSRRVSPLPNGVSHWGGINSSKPFKSIYGPTKKFFSASLPGSRIASRATSPTRQLSPPPYGGATVPTSALARITSTCVAEDTKRKNDGLGEEILKLRTQVEDRSRKAQLQEIELETITKQLKEAIIIAREETSKREAAKEVIKLLTGQLKDMAERVSIGTAATESKSPPPPSLTCSFTPKPSIDLDSNSLVRYNNGSSTMCSSRPSSENRREGESNHGTEWVEQDEPGVYITLVSLPGGVKDLKRVRFSRKQFSEKEAEQWWAANKSRVQQQYKGPAAH